MSDTDNSNGSSKGQDGRAKRPTLILEVTDPLTGTLQISGDVPSIDYALNMLAQATREYEAQWRLARMAAMQQQQIINAENERIRRELAGRH